MHFVVGSEGWKSKETDPESAPKFYDDEDGRAKNDL